MYAELKIASGEGGGGGDGPGKSRKPRSTPRVNILELLSNVGSLKHSSVHTNHT